MAFSPEGERLYVAGYREITVWTLDGRLRRRINNLPERIHAIDASGDQLAEYFQDE